MSDSRRHLHGNAPVANACRDPVWRTVCPPAPAVRPGQAADDRHLCGARSALSGASWRDGLPDPLARQTPRICPPSAKITRKCIQHGGLAVLLPSTTACFWWTVGASDLDRCRQQSSSRRRDPAPVVEVERSDTRAVVTLYGDLDFIDRMTPGRSANHNFAVATFWTAQINCTLTLAAWRVLHRVRRELREAFSAARRSGESSTTVSSSSAGDCRNRLDAVPTSVLARCDGARASEDLQCAPLL